MVITTCISSFCYTHVITCARFWLLKVKGLTKAMAEMKTEYWTKDEIEQLYKEGSQCELSSWPDKTVRYSVWTKLCGHGFKSHSGQLSKNALVVNTIWLHSPMLMWSPMQDFDRGKCGNSRRNSQNEIWIMNKRWNCSNCAKLALSASWTHGLTAQVVRASEQNSVVLGWNPFQGNFW